MNLVFVVNNPYYFISHRMPIGLELIKQGFQVHIIAPGNCPVEIKQAGFVYHEIKMSRKGKNPFNELISIWELLRLFKKIKPDLVHLVTVKPYLYGGIAARIARVPAVVSAVAGLGILFSQKNTKNRVLRVFLYPFYQIAFGHKKQQVIFQNTNDRDLLINWGVLDEKKTVLIRGAGADLTQYKYDDEPKGIPVISLASRLLFDKGVSEFVEASRILKKRMLEVDFWLIGEPDLGNNNSVTNEYLKKCQDENLIKYLGFRSDIPSLFSQSNIVVLPSYYGEGLPKILIEAACCGRAVVTTDHPGCRDAIEPNQTGLLIPIKSPVALADAIEYLINNPKERKKMGVAGRALAEKEFSIEKIVDEHMNIYNELVKK